MFSPTSIMEKVSSIGIWYSLIFGKYFVKPQREVSIIMQHVSLSRSLFVGGREVEHSIMSSAFSACSDNHLKSSLAIHIFLLLSSCENNYYCPGITGQLWALDTAVSRAAAAVLLAAVWLLREQWCWLLFLYPY